MKSVPWKTNERGPSIIRAGHARSRDTLLHKVRIWRANVARLEFGKKRVVQFLARRANAPTCAGTLVSHVAGVTLRVINGISTESRQTLQCEDKGVAPVAAGEHERGRHARVDLRTHSWFSFFQLVYLGLELFPQSPRVGNDRSASRDRARPARARETPPLGPHRTVCLETTGAKPQFEKVPRRPRVSEVPRAPKSRPDSDVVVCVPRSRETSTSAFDLLVIENPSSDASHPFLKNPTEISTDSAKKNSAAQSEQRAVRRAQLCAQSLAHGTATRARLQRERQPLASAPRELDGRPPRSELDGGRHDIL